ncbi:hypothetical protein CJ030_MR4G020416 [Morella rubra]|uniref:GRF-type domain-containing protein n=1 Tax=Morella rubra TaxID=262757 RepID=A0A6A1VS46_9ROSI|nr:hypothetical protein CJ030_MR4G020416 [Morella rubra]
MSSSSISSASETPVSFVLCYCGIEAKMRTSWTEKNPGRRFFGCLRYGLVMGPRCCEFFEWVDPPKCKRSSQVIPGLKRKIKMLEAQLEVQRAREKRLVVAFDVSWVIGIVVFHAALRLVRSRSQ